MVTRVILPLSPRLRQGCETPRRRAAEWRAEVAEGLDAATDLPKVSVALPMGSLYPS